MKPTSFEAYFEGQFPADLDAFLDAMPDGQRKHFMKSPESYSISMNYLVEPELALHVIPLGRRPYYAAALYFTSLMDQGMYYHHPDCYERYRRLTDYPKLTGACPGACMYIAEPTMALERTNLFDADPSDYIQRRPDRLAQNAQMLAPVLQEARDYFRRAFPSFLRRHLPHIAEPEALYRRLFNDWCEVQVGVVPQASPRPDYPVNPVLLAEPKVLPGPFHIAAGWGPLIEVRPETPVNPRRTLTLADGLGACVELDFAPVSGDFAGLRLLRYHKVGDRQRPKELPRHAGLPSLLREGSAAMLTVGRITCSKQMTSSGYGDLFIDWSERRAYDQASSFPLQRHGVLHFYYLRQELAAVCLERIPVTIFNEMPHFEADGR